MKQNWTHTTRTEIKAGVYEYDRKSKTNVLVSADEAVTIDNYEMSVGRYDVVISGTPGSWTAEVTDNSNGSPSSVRCEKFIKFDEAEAWVTRHLLDVAVSASWAIEVIKRGWKE